MAVGAHDKQLSRYVDRMLAQRSSNGPALARQPVDCHLDAMTRQVGCNVCAGFRTLFAITFDRIDKNNANVVGGA